MNERAELMKIAARLTELAYPDSKKTNTAPFKKRFKDQKKADSYDALDAFDVVLDHLNSKLPDREPL